MLQEKDMHIIGVMGSLSGDGTPTQLTLKLTGQGNYSYLFYNDGTDIYFERITSSSQLFSVYKGPLFLVSRGKGAISNSTSTNSNLISAFSLFALTETNGTAVVGYTYVAGNGGSVTLSASLT